MLSDIIWFIFSRFIFFFNISIINLVCLIFGWAEHSISIKIRCSLFQAELICVFHSYFSCERLFHHFFVNRKYSLRRWHNIWCRSFITLYTIRFSALLFVRFLITSALILWLTYTFCSWSWWPRVKSSDYLIFWRI